MSTGTKAITVAELIEQLKECDEDLAVVIDHEKAGRVIEVKGLSWSDKDQVALEIE